MARDEILNRYALIDDNKRIVSIDDVNRLLVRLHKFYCPHCHNEMYATFGEIQKSHFRHKGHKCQYNMYLHDLAEIVFYEEYSKCMDEGLPFYLEICIPLHCNEACVLKKHLDCKEHYIKRTIDLTKEYKLISLEKRVNLGERYRRPDILLESLDGKQLWVEIWVSHETAEDKRYEGRIIEIKIESEKDLDKIRHHKLVQSEGEDLAVRTFKIDIDKADSFFTNNKEFETFVYPCEKFFCFEVHTKDFKAQILDHYRTTIDSDLIYGIVLRLNWRGCHDSTGGHKGTQITLDDLYDNCLERYYTLYYKQELNWDNSYDSLIVSECIAESIKPLLDQTVTPKYSIIYIPYHQASTLPEASTTIIPVIEWIDLGLPSKTLWAKEDIEAKLSFGEARRSYGTYLPSQTEASELNECCTKEWDEISRTLVFTGPNGNSISFSCSNKDNSYWLNDYENGNTEFGQCFHIGSDCHFWINDRDVISAISVRLVR